MYSLSTTKKLFTTAALIASFSISAQTPEQIEEALVDLFSNVNTEFMGDINELSLDLRSADVSSPVTTSDDTTIVEVETASDDTTIVEYTEETDTQENRIETKVSTAMTGLTAQTCPENFYQVKLPNNGKLCQVFAADLPASMIFFVPQLPEEVVAFYQQDSAIFSTTKQVKDRMLLQSEDKNTTLIISTDGNGTQVDVLVKSSTS